MKNIYSLFIYADKTKDFYSYLEYYNRIKHSIELLKIDENYLPNRVNKTKNIYEIVFKCEEDIAYSLREKILGNRRNAGIGLYKRPNIYKPTTFYERTKTIRKINNYKVIKEMLK